MFNHHFRIAVRALLKQRSHTIVNVMGLAIGLAACVLTMLFIKDEWSYDTHHESAPHIFRLIHGNNTRMPGAAGSALKQNFPEVASAVRMRATRAIWLMRFGDREFHEDRVYWTESSLFDVFTIPLLKGNPATALEGQDKAVISESMARKYFGDTDPMGEVIRLDNTYSFTITGVMEDFPGHTHFTSDLFLSFGPELDYMDNWWSATYYTYLRLNDRSLAPELTSKFQAYFDSEIRPGNPQSIRDYRFSLQPLTSIHLRSNLLNELETNSSMAHLYTLMTGAVFLLLIACINFINLSMVQSTARAKEVGLMKVFGANRSRIVVQYLSGSVMIAGLVLVLAVVLAWLSLPAFNTITGKSLSMSFTQHLDVWLGLIAVSVLVGALSGSFPATVLSGFRPMDALSRRLSQAIDYPFVKRTLITAQFALSVILIIGTGVVYGQLRYMMNEPPGFQKSDVLIVPLISGFFMQVDESSSSEGPQQFKSRSSEGFQNELLQSPYIQSVSLSGYVPGLAPGRGMIGETMVRRGDDSDVPASSSIRIVNVEHDFFETLGMDLILGTNLKPRDMRMFNPFAVFEVILNETAIRHLGWTSADSALDKTIELVSPRFVQRGRIIGVVQDAHFRSLYQPVEPMVFIYSTFGEHMSIRLQPGGTASALEDLNRVWRSHYPEIPLVYSFLEDDIDQLYLPEERLGMLFGICALLAIVLTFLGLFNLVSLTVHQRTKEIGVRKILGATRPQLVQLLSREFVVMAIAGSAIAWPIAYLVLDSWLQDFAYRIAPSPALFILVGLAVLATATATVGLHVLRAARSNPVEALRYE
ncbi:MAG: FtsX-like permease family protein [Gemmatimonadetes bacterium]|nr:FtsX-like permease family protein [Gemmatimonadota bacterium]